MAPVPCGLLQAADGDTTVLAVVVVVILLGIGYVVVRAGIDKLTGAHEDEAVYQLARYGDTGLVLRAPDGAAGQPVELDAETMRRLIDAVDARNEMRLHAVVLPDGEEVTFESHDLAGHAPRAIIVEDSRGLLRISIAGLIEAKPPLDDAVKGDLLEVFRGVLDPDAPRAG